MTHHKFARFRQPSVHSPSNRLSCPRITVGIVIFNGLPFIRAALESVFAQSYPHIELVVVDGGSKDGTLDVLRSNAPRIDRLVSEPDVGIYDAMNKCCALAQGDWLIFLGCDDVLINCLHTVSIKMVDATAIYYGNVIIKGEGRVSGGRFSKYRLMQENICHQAIFYPRVVYRNLRYDLRYPVMADYEYNLRAVGQGTPYVFLDVNVAVFNDQGVSQGGDVQLTRDLHWLIYENFGPFWGLLKSLRTALVCIVKPAVHTVRRIVRGNKVQ